MAYVQDVMPLDTPSILYMQETRVVTNISEEIAGTVDLVIVTDDELHVIDFKFGKGVKVSIEYNGSYNEQLMAYLNGSLNKLESLKHTQPKVADRPRAMHIHIVQPRIDNYQMASISEVDLQVFEKKARDMLKELDSEYPSISPGPTQCRWCPVGALCKDRIQFVQAEQTKLMSAFADLEDGILTIEEAVEVLQKEDEVKQTYTDIRKFLYGMAMQGKEIPGYKVVQKTKNRAWLPGTTIDDIIAVAPVLEDNMDMLIKSTLITPAQIEKLIGKGKAMAETRDAVNTLIHKPLGEYALVAESDKGTAVTVNAAVDLFSQFGDTNG